jgi:hypothetical protein
LDKNIEEKVKSIGSDGKLVHTAAGNVLKVNLTEKILVSLLVKLSNFVPEGGIWMNTQRPEWNDANNALAGNGLSMVTLYYLRRFIDKSVELFGSMQGSIEISEEVYQLLQSLHKIFTENKTLLSGKINDGERRNMVDSLGLAGSAYRWKLYTQGFSERKQHLDIGEWIGFLRLSLEYLNHRMEANKREDRLYHSYNFVEFGRNSCRVAHLYQMLEGQVAVLSSGYLDAKESLEVLDALHESTMYRKDQNSYTLYPDRDLPGFLEKNIIPSEKLDQSTDLLERLTKGKFNIVEVDGTGQIHFNGSLRNVSNLKERLEQIQEISAEEKDRICQVFIDCFKHKQFTGRSGSFYKYEGLGSIYWHMVSKLLLAVQESYFQAVEQKEDTVSVSSLRVHYHQIKDGLGLGKPPEIYGAFPTDPYSHTPGFAGVQQPGMTGQVKEDFLTRFGELGVSVINGCISVSQGLISRDEFLDSEYEWNIHGRILRLSKGEMGFTVCGTPFILSTGNSNSIDIHLSAGQIIQLKNKLIIDQRLSSMVFNRTGDINCIRVEIQGN